MKKSFAVGLAFLSIALVSAQTLDQYLVSSKTLNMRAGEGKDFEVVATLSQGDAVSVIEKNESGWWYVDFDGTEGYVFSKYLKKDPNSGWYQWFLPN